MNINVLSISAIILSAIAVVGCATQAQLQYQSRSAEAEQAHAAADACYEKLDSAPEWSTLKLVLSTGPEDPALPKKLNIDRPANDLEKSAILTRFPKVQACRKPLIEKFGGIDARFAAELAAWFSVNDLMIADLLSEKITIGDWNRRHAEMHPKRLQRWNEISAEVTRGYERAHSEEVASRQSAQAAFNQWTYQQQVIRALSQSYKTPAISTTNCTYFGNMMNCTHQ